MLLIPIMVVALISTISMLANKSQNKPTAIFGNYLVTIQSGSMTQDGFFIGDTVLTRQTDITDLKLGDIIAFYDYKDPTDPDVVNIALVAKYNNVTGLGLDRSEENITYGSIDVNSIERKNVERAKTVKDAQSSKVKINFHTIIGNKSLRS